MSAIAALKGYRTQFLYSLHYILSNQDKDYQYRLEGEEDLDILNEQGDLLMAIQVKNLNRAVIPSDLVNTKRTSFLRRYIDRYPGALPRLVSFGPISSEVKSIRDGGSSKIKNTVAESFTQSQWQLISKKIDLVEVEEAVLISEILANLQSYKQIDPVPTAENLLYWLQIIAERQAIVTSRDVYNKIESIAVYLSERIAIKDRYGIYVKPLHLSDLTSLDSKSLKEEFYNGASARYEHIQLGLDVLRSTHLNKMHEQFKLENTVILHGASGQGKSTLAYRYAFENTPNSLIYELNVQQDTIGTIESIVALNSVLKSLDAPILFIINVTPNTTSWLRIVQAFKNNISIKFLITVRNEDWYRASTSGMDFSFSKLELKLSKEEAEQIYELLKGKLELGRFINFHELWTILGNDAPLLELVYTIVQGDSLKNRLRQQISNIASDENSYGGLPGQIEFLRILSLIGSFDGHIDAEKLKKYPNILFIIEKFEREYLIKKDSTAKLLTGLHPIRSKMLCELLFDNFVAEKKDFIHPSLQYIYDTDVFSFLIQSFFDELTTPKQVLNILNDLKPISWVYYKSINSAFIWKGVSDFVAINKPLLYSVIEKFGDGWYAVVDLYHGNSYDPQSILEIFSNDRQDLLDFLRDVNSNLSNKEQVFTYSSKLFDSLPLPQSLPQTQNDWKAFGEILFWVSNVTSTVDRSIHFIEKDFADAFRELDIESLSKLMLGLFYYSSKTNEIRSNLASIFTARLRHQFNIPLLTINEDVSVDILFDFLRDEDSLVSQHQNIVSILDVLRSAFPDKANFKTQSHGHRLSTIPLGFDDSRKEVSIKNLPLSEWVNVNATTRRILEFELRPQGWSEFINEMLVWESGVADVLKSFEKSIRVFRTNGEYSSIIPITDQANYTSGSRLKIPRTVSDKFGLPTNAKSNENESNQQKEEIFSAIYKEFFTAQSEFRSSVENFISQSGKALYDILKRKLDPNHEVDSHLLYLSYINLYSACEKNNEYQTQKDRYFGHILDSRNKPIQTNYLHLLATMWKSLVNAIESENPKKIVTTEGITSLCQDFEVRLKRTFNAVAKSTGVSYRYLRPLSDDKAIFVLNARTSIDYLIALSHYYNALHGIVGDVECQSLRYLMLESKFSSFSFLPIVKGHSLDNQWQVFKLYVVKGKNFEMLEFHNAISLTIDTEFVTSLKLKSWEEVHPKFINLKTLKTEFSRLLFLLDHLKDLKFFDEEELDQVGLTMVQNHTEQVWEKIEKSFQFVVDRLSEIMNIYPLDENVYQASEFEQMYRKYMLEVLENIHTPRDSDPNNSERTFTLQMLEDWFNRLHALFPSWNIFASLLHGKHVASTQDTL